MKRDLYFKEYFVAGSNQPIISQEIFDAAKSLMRKRAQKIMTGTMVSLPLAMKLQCGCCGALFKKKLHHREVYWTCRTHDIDKEKCAITQISQAVFYRAFCCLYYNLKHHGNPILNTMLTSLQAIRSRQMLWSLDVIELNKQISELTSQNQMLATLKQQGLIDPDIFISQSNELTKKLRTVKLEKERLLAADGDNTIVQTRELMEILDDGPDFLNSFDAGLFGELVDKIIVDSNEQLRFRLKNGLELVETIERTVR